MIWGASESAIFDIGTFNLLVALGVCLVAQYRKLDYSDRITIFLWVMFDAATLLVTPVIFSLNEIDKELTRQVWYTSFAFIALTQMMVMNWAHNKFRYKKSDLSKFVVFALTCLVFFNVFRYFDRLVLETNVLADVYRYGTMSAKIIVLLAFVRVVAKNKGVSFAS